VIGRIDATARELRHELISDISRRDLDTCIRVLSRIRAKAENANQNGKNGKRSLTGEEQSK
jgi:hypothetical protein